MVPIRLVIAEGRAFLCETMKIVLGCWFSTGICQMGDGLVMTEASHEAGS
ncbi:MAG: hypothetical protein ACRDJT_00680 [Actinomycetota bacterium]